MKRLISLWFLLGWLGLASCTTNPPPPTLAPTSAVAQLPDTPTPTPTTTLTPIPSSPTATTTLEPTVTSTTTPSPSLTPTVALPLPQGRLFFFWDPRSHTSAEEPSPNLYMVSANPQTNQWEVQTLLYHINLVNNPLTIIPNLLVSPNQEWLALVVAGNLADNLTPRQRPPDPSTPTIYVFNLNDFSYQPLVTDSWVPYLAAWLDDSQTLAYVTGLGKYRINLTDKTPQPLDIFVNENDFVDIRLSPDKRFWVIAPRNKSDILFYDNSTNQTLSLPNMPFRFEVIWSPFSDWLAVMPHLSVINPQTLETLTISNGLNLYLAWSYDNQWLAFTEQLPNILNPPNHLKVWITQNTQSLTLLENYLLISEPLWHSDNQHLTIGLLKENLSSLSLINISDRTVNSIYSSSEKQQIIPCAWSPDGEWLVFYMQNGELTRSGIYLIHQSGQGLHPLVESDGRIMTPDGATSPPGGCFWLSQ